MALEHFGNEGKRVIAFAQKKFYASAKAKFCKKRTNSTDEFKSELNLGTDNKNSKFVEESYPDKDLVFFGMVAMMDPPRNDTAAAIQQCKDAGIKVFMITGDHPTAASAIALQIGLIATDDNHRLKVFF